MMTNHHKLSTSDCVNLFSAWLIEDANQLGEIYERVEEYTDIDELKSLVPEMAGSIDVYRFSLRLFLAGFFIGQEDGLKLDEAMIDDVVEMVLGKHGLSQEGKALYESMVKMGLVSGDQRVP